MQALTDVIEPLSLDEAYLDLAGDVRHNRETSAATQLAELARRVKAEIGISISIGLAPNKFLAKLASDMDKPRGFWVIGHREAEAVLADMPVSAIHGIGPATQKRLAARGITKIRQLQSMTDAELKGHFGKFGDRLAMFVRGNDPRRVKPDRETKSISNETTFREDLRAPDDLVSIVLPLCEKVAERLVRAGLSGRTVVLKLKTADFQLLTRNVRLSTPTQRAETLLAAAERLIAREADGRAFRLIGIGVHDLDDATSADPPDLFSQ